MLSWENYFQITKTYGFNDATNQTVMIFGGRCKNTS